MNDILKQFEESRALSDALLHLLEAAFDDDELTASFQQSAMLQELLDLSKSISKTDWAVEMHYHGCPCGPESYLPPS